MNKLITRGLATTIAAAAVLGGGAATAQADSYSFPQVGVGQERCVRKAASSVTVFGVSTPHVARFQVSRNGVVLYQATSSVFGSTYYGSGLYEFCGKNKLGNPGPIDLYLQVN